jgi:hypothetical protein
MAIRAACPCGAQFAAKAELAGKTVTCPNCGGSMVVPAGPAAPRQQSPQVPPASDDFWSQAPPAGQGANGTRLGFGWVKNAIENCCW